MTLTVTDEPPDRPGWVRETIRLVTATSERRRNELLERVARTSDADLVAGSPNDWGFGQIAVHLLLVERGVFGITLNLAIGVAVGATGQPRPAASAVTRDGIASLAGKAAFAMERLRRDFPAEPNMTSVARHPFYGDLNAFGWLLTLTNHYQAHLEAWDRGAKSAL